MDEAGALLRVRARRSCPTFLTLGRRDSGPSTIGNVEIRRGNGLNLTDEQWAAWAYRRPHHSARTSLLLAIVSGGAALLCSWSVLNMALPAGPESWLHWLLLLVNLGLGSLNAVWALRYIKGRRYARIREATPIPRDIEMFFLTLRVDDYLQQKHQRRRALAAVGRQLRGRG